MEARKAAIEEKRRRIEALKAQKAERAKAGASQSSATFKAATLRTYVDGLLASSSSEAAKAAPEASSRSVGTPEKAEKAAVPPSPGAAPASMPVERMPFSPRAAGSREPLG